MQLLQASHHSVFNFTEEALHLSVYRAGVIWQRDLLPPGDAAVAAQLTPVVHVAVRPAVEGRLCVTLVHAVRSRSSELKVIRSQERQIWLRFVPAASRS